MCIIGVTVSVYRWHDFKKYIKKIILFYNIERMKYLGINKEVKDVNLLNVDF
jgi:hypothetical protein